MYHGRNGNFLESLLKAPDTVDRNNANLIPRRIQDMELVANAQNEVLFEGAKQFAGGTAKSKRQNMWSEVGHPWGRTPGWILGMSFLIPRRNAAGAAAPTWDDVGAMLEGFWTLLLNDKPVTWGEVEDCPQLTGAAYQAGEATAAAPPTAQGHTNSPLNTCFPFLFPEPFFKGPDDKIGIKVEWPGNATMAATTHLRLKLATAFLAKPA